MDSEPHGRLRRRGALAEMKPGQKHGHANARGPARTISRDYAACGVQSPARVHRPSSLSPRSTSTEAKRHARFATVHRGSWRYKSPRHDRAQRNRAVQRRERRSVTRHDAGNDASLTASFESTASGDHFVQDQAEAEDIGARVGLPALELLRRHVLERADNEALSVRGVVAVGSAVRLPEVPAPGSCTLARPKSGSLAPPLVSMILPGFRSR
jgi:hypothetical protein